MAATMTPTPTGDIYNGDSKVYTSTASIQLKVKSGDFVWHTEVLTPPKTPVATETEIEKEHVSPANTAAAVVGAATAAGVGAAICQYNSTTSTSKPKPVPISKAVSNFMESERCHTEHIENMNQFVSSL